MSTATTTAPAPDKTNGDRPKETAVAISPERLPYHPLIQDRFNIDRASWRALVGAIFPNATSTDSVILALSYCRARRLDAFKRVVHIVPIWNKQLGRMIDSVWPGIGELRTTAFRTGEYAGRDRAEWGPMLMQQIGNVEVVFPEWCRVTLYRMIHDQRVAFAGPEVYWLETYAESGRNDVTPNEMWRGRPRGQLEKCAEAAALRAAFPEECGGDYIPEEVQHGQAQTVDVKVKEAQSLDSLADRLLEGKPEEMAEFATRDQSGAHVPLSAEHRREASTPKEEAKSQQTEQPKSDEPAASDEDLITDLERDLDAINSNSEVTDAVFAAAQKHPHLASKFAELGAARKDKLRGERKKEPAKA